MAAFGIEYSVFVGGTLGREGPIGWSRTNDTGDGLGQTQMASTLTVTSTDPASAFDNLCSPNVVPKARTPAQMGLTVSGALVNVIPYLGLSYELQSPPADFNETKVRFWFRQFQVRLRWTDGVSTFPLVGRAVLVGGSEFVSFDSARPQDYGIRYGFSSLGPAYFVGGNVESTPGFQVKQIRNDLLGITTEFSGAGLVDYTLTDPSGIASYYGLMAVSLGIKSGGGYTWTPIYTGSNPTLGLFPNLGMAWNQKEILAGAHSASQYSDPTIPTDNTAGWSPSNLVWNAGTGMFTMPDPAMVTFDYHQTGTVTLLQDNYGVIPNSVIPGTVKLQWGGLTYTGTSGVPIPAIPAGSLMKDVRQQPSEPPFSPLTDLTMLSASGFPNASVVGQEPHTVSPYQATTEYRVTPYSGKSGTDLTGVTLGDAFLAGPYAEDGLFIGGEVVTEPYFITWAATDGSGRTSENVGPSGPPVPLTLYLTDQDSGGTYAFSARLLSRTAPSVEGSAASPTGMATGWGELASRGAAFPWAAAGAEPGPSGNGFVFDVPDLEGQQMKAGMWTPTIKLSTSSHTITADLHMRAYRRTFAGVFTLIAEAVQAGASITGAPAVYSLTGVAGAATNFATGDEVYIDVLMNITANTSTDPVATTSLFENGGANEAFVTPGYVDLFPRYLWIHEEDNASIGIPLPTTTPAMPVKAAAGGLDYAMDPAGEPWLSVGREDQVEQYSSSSMEKSFGFRSIIPEGGTSPSRCIAADHEHLMALIDVHGVCNLWHSTDLLDWSKVGIIASVSADKNPFVGATMRKAPDDSLHVWLVSTAGQLTKQESMDGGDSWAGVAISGVPALIPERIDVRFEGAQWLLLATKADDGTLNLYTSDDGVTFAFGAQVFP